MNKKMIGSVGICIRFFIYSWIVSYAIMIIMPAEPRYPNKTMNFTVNIIFVIIIIVIAIFVYKLFKGITKNNARTLHNNKLYKNLSKIKLLFIIKCSSLGSMIGIVLIIYDRIFIRGINYRLGIRNARYQWFESAASGLGGSVFSVLGNLLVPFSYVGISMVILYWEQLTYKQKAFGLLAGLLVPFVHAVLNGGRSNVFILVMLLICIFVFRRSINKSFLPEIKGKYVKLIVIALFALFFSMQIFSSSAKLGSVNDYEYTNVLIDGLRGKLNENLNNLKGNGGIIYQITSVGAYLIHGQWVAQESYILQSRPGKFTFTFILEILKSAGIYKKDIEPNAFSEMGTFISLPGALYYDYNFVGLILGSICLGILFGIALIILNFSSNKNGIHIAFVIEILMLLYLSPLFIANGLMYFNFVIFAFVSMEVISRIFFGASSWLRLDS